MSDTITMPSKTANPHLGIIADTPFFSMEGSISIDGLPSALEMAGLSTFEELWTAPPETLQRALASVAVRIENGTYGGRKPLTVADVGRGAPASLIEALQRTDKAFAGTTLSAKSLAAYLG